MPLKKLQKQLLNLLRENAKKMGPDGKTLTGLIGELSVCIINFPEFKLKWEPSVGYDCLDQNEKKYEIKTRKDSKGRKEVNSKGTVGRYGKRDKYIFDIGLYVELNEYYEVSRTYEMPCDEIRRLELQSTRKDKCLTVGTFRRKGRPIYPLNNSSE